jgi:hypothetical protein
MHRDLETASSEALGAEQWLIGHELARRTFRRVSRLRIIQTTADGGFVDDVSWLRERVALIGAELRRRQPATSCPC